MTHGRAVHYAPLAILGQPEACAREWLAELDADLQAGALERIDGGEGIALYLRALAWDSSYFGVPSFRLEYTDIPHGCGVAALAQAYARLRALLVERHPRFYLMAEVPAEDSAAIGGMSRAAWRMIETRITSYRDDIQRFAAARRYAVRDATDADVPDLRQAAIDAVNLYDRFHADDFFTRAEADAFLATYIANSVAGFADEVIVPATGPANAFLTALYLPEAPALPGRKIGKMVLSAVAAARSGWYVKLIGEMSMRMRERGVDSVFMTTQATNRAVLKVWQHHGYRYGRCTHLFSTYERHKP